MPRYSYYCEICEQTSELFHLIDEQPDQCAHCGAKHTLVKLVSRPRINTNKTEIKETVQNRVEGHIEKAREELHEQRAGLKNEDMIDDS